MDKLDMSSSFSNFDGFRSRTSAFGMVNACHDIEGILGEQRDVERKDKE